LEGHFSPWKKEVHSKPERMPSFSKILTQHGNQLHQPPLIGLGLFTSNGTPDNVPGGDYQYPQTTFSMPLNCKTLDVSFAVDDAVKSVAVSDGTKTLKQTITSFSGGGNGCGVRRIGNFQSFDGLACYYHTDLP